jgi:hypothetical protein
MNLRIIVVVGAALATFALGAISLPRSKPASLPRSRPEPARVSSPDVPGERAPSKVQVGRSSQEDTSAQARLQVPSTPPEPASSPANSADDEAEAPGEWTNPVERQRQQIANLMRDLETRFASETFDPSWSRSMEQTLRSELATKTTGSTVLESSCASTMCRIVLRHESSDVQRALAYTVTELAPFQTGVFYDYDKSSDPPRSTLYVMREGHELNEVDGS